MSSQIWNLNASTLIFLNSSPENDFQPLFQQDYHKQCFFYLIYQFNCKIIIIFWVFLSENVLKYMHFGTIFSYFAHFLPYNGKTVLLKTKSLKLNQFLTIMGKNSIKNTGCLRKIQILTFKNDCSYEAQNMPKAWVKLVPNFKS